MKAKEYRVLAAEKCTRVEGKLALTSLIIALISAAVEGASYYIGGLAGTLVAGPLALGFAAIIAKVYNGGDFEIGEVFSAFKSNFLNSWLLNLLKELFIVLWSILLVVPGIIAECAYSMSEFIMNDNPNIGSYEAIKASKAMMKGHKWNYFCLMLSYIGWILLCVLTAGILSLWVAPRMEAASYAFYLDIKGGNQAEEQPAEETAEEAK